MKILILAGGSGERLWPLSRRSRPKQFQKLISEKMLIEDTLERFTKIFNPKYIYIIGEKRFSRFFKKLLPGIPVQNIIYEPSPKNTAAAIGLGASYIKNKIKNEKEVIAILPSDHFIKYPKRLILTLKKAESFSKKNRHIVIIGIKPSYPETGYGYIKAGKLIDKKNKVFLVDKFIEKPDLNKAKKLIKSPKYFWNAGIFIAKIETILEGIKTHLPKHYSILKKINGTSKIKRYWPKLKNISFEYGVAEKLNEIAVVTANMGWSDIGSWHSLKSCLQVKIDENIIIGNHLGVDTKNSLVLGDKKLIATLGLKNIVIIDTEDALFVCDSRKSQDIKKLVKKLKKKNKIKYL